MGHDDRKRPLKGVVEVSEIAGVRAIITHAIDEDAIHFYQHHGFLRCPLGDRVMLLPIEAARAAL
jgi:hypothetical protein